MDKHIEAVKKTELPPWDDLRLRRTWDSLEDKLDTPLVTAQPARPKWGWALAAACVTLVISAFIWWPKSTKESKKPFLSFAPQTPGSPFTPKRTKPNTHIASSAKNTPTKSEPAILTLMDGSRARTAASAAVHIVTSTSKQITLVQQKGRVAYEVTKRKSRTFTVKAKGVEVNVLGTQFSVQVLPDNTVVVSVTEGTVRAADSTRSVVLQAGESVTLKGRDASPVPKTNHETRIASTVKSLPVVAAKSKPAKKSFKTMMSKVDQARRLGDKSLAAKLLRKATSIPSSDPNQITAFFILARMEFSLGRYGAAARAYRGYLRRSPRGTLAMDALAGEARSRFRNGKTVAAKKLAKEYLSRFKGTLHEKRMKEILK